MPDLVVRFVAERGFISAGIRYVTFSDFSHAELGLPDGTWLGAHAVGGVQIRAVDYLKPSFERVYAIPVDQASYSLAMAYARSKVGTRYNFPDILGLLVHAPMTSPHRLICSQFMFEVLSQAGLKPLNVLSAFSYRVTPDMLHLSPIFIGRCIRQTKPPE